MQAVLISLHSLWQQIDALDKRLFLLLNSKWTNPFFDFILPYFRDSVFWAPLYLFIVVFMALNYGKKGLWWSIFFLCTVALADTVSSKGFKESFQRLRPCQDPFFLDQVRLLLKGCSGSYSFTSSHAANHFGMATYVSVTLYSTFKRWIYVFYLWAFFISYAQIYVGVHYPLDVLGGGIVGAACGLLTAYGFHKRAGYLNLEV
ncbi:phosphatase PAP2 family protein [Paraflavisolibacter sp. H34]|uniref:phosphatase PAP2 family protein n=1 Tax=Huijunlia imazamoxiresistens TaxID=3127457 RepID=UPI0030174175